MLFYWKIFRESLSQAIQQLLGNKLRSFLSFLGITIGIFCIIGVKAAVDSLEDNIRGSFKKLGSDVVYVSKMPWGGGRSRTDFERFKKRPNPSTEDLKVIQERSQTAELASFAVFGGVKTLKFNNNSVQNVVLFGASYDYVDMFKLNIQYGRYYSQAEYQYGSNQCLLGAKVVEALFGSVDPVGKMIDVGGRKMQVIGVFEKSGKDLLRIADHDETIIVSIPLARKFVNIHPQSGFMTLLNVKCKKGYTLAQLKDELTGILRSKRHISPRDENNFALNEMSSLTAILDQFFSVLNLAGFVIGVFALIVGMVSVANIMFVSVKERTGLIGIKMAIGAKRYMILLEFLVESVILCIIGGILGLLLVALVAVILSLVLDFKLTLSSSNMVIGIMVSVVVGIIAGMIPALQASKMYPVDAIRA